MLQIWYIRALPPFCCDSPGSVFLKEVVLYSAGFLLFHIQPLAALGACTYLLISGIKKVIDVNERNLILTPRKNLIL